MAFVNDSPNRRSGTKLVPAGLSVRISVRDDIPSLLALDAEGQDDLAGFRKRLESEVLESESGARGVLLVAELKDTIIGYARARKVDNPRRSSKVPNGWYLLGIFVHEDLRRRGIASALTLERLRHVARRSTTCYYFASSANDASISLHERFGFLEDRRNFRFPGVDFGAARGILYKLDLRRTGLVAKSSPSSRLSMQGRLPIDEDSAITESGRTPRDDLNGSGSGRLRGPR